MKKKSDSKTGKIASRLFNVRGWSDWDRVKSFTGYLRTGITQMFVPQTATPSETFDEAAKRLNLDNAAILTKQKALYRLAVLMVLCAIGITFYMIYMLIFGSIKAAIVSLVLVLIALAFAFKYHFWYFQMKNRKLGCTFKEWYQQGLLGEKND